MTAPTIPADPNRCACLGAPTIAVTECGGPMQECVACGSGVADDLVDHRILGFAASCDRVAKEAA